MKRLFTLGTDRRSEEDFIEVLLFYDIQTVADVRSFPRSRIPIFTMGPLRDLLEKEGLSYVFLGAELGGFRKGGYEAYTSGEGFRAGIDKLEEIARSTATVIICAEKFPWKCHRKWIARELHGRGWTVEHIIDKGRVWIPGQKADHEKRSRPDH